MHMHVLPAGQIFFAPLEPINYGGRYKVPLVDQDRPKGVDTNTGQAIAGCF